MAAVAESKSKNESGVMVFDLAQLDAAFSHVTPRAGEMEKLHAAVWSKVDNFKSALYRDFPDANRMTTTPKQE